MTAGTSSTLKLDSADPVLIAYGTTLVKNGRIHFYDDVYGLDRQLDAALRQRPPRP
jgi:murein L,D-transpeptidase YcbB/YkuD